MQECPCVVLTYKQAHALLIYMSRVGLTHTHTYSRTFAQATRSPLAPVGQLAHVAFGRRKIASQTTKAIILALPGLSRHFTKEITKNKLLRSFKRESFDLI